MHAFNNRSEIRGVTWNKEMKMYQAQIKKDGRNYNLGYFLEPEDAQREYLTSAKKLYGKAAFSLPSDKREAI